MHSPKSKTSKSFWSTAVLACNKNITLTEKSWQNIPCDGFPLSSRHLVTDIWFLTSVNYKFKPNNLIHEWAKRKKQNHQISAILWDGTTIWRRDVKKERSVSSWSFSTYSLPQSNLAVMCCLTSLMRSWVRWPTSTCLLRSKISFITCQSRWNKSPSFFCRRRKQRGGTE